MRLRVTYRITEALRYVGTIDMQKVWERLLRRANIPVKYSQGFHPQPKIQLACPLPVGFLSDHEVIDFWVDDEVSFNEIRARLISTSQPGIEITSVMVADDKESALQNLADVCEYHVTLFGDCDVITLTNQVSAVLEAENLPRVRRGKAYDLRPLIHQIEVIANDPVALVMTLSAKPGATGRPEEVLDALGVDPHDARYRRTRIDFSN